MLTDSGGYQVFSLAHMRKVDPDGVTFRSHIDGSLHRFTPERAMATQEKLGADIIMCLDECPEPLDRDYNEEALARTHAWAERCKAAQKRPDQALFGIVQGGIFPDLRTESARNLRLWTSPAMPWAVWRRRNQRTDVCHAGRHLPALPADKPRYLMGVGAPEDILEGVARGIDIFDCVLPTRTARNGGLLTRQGRLNLRNARMPPIRCLSRRDATAMPANISAAPTCGTCSSPKKSWVCTWRRSIMCTSCCA